MVQARPRLQGEAMRRAARKDRNHSEIDEALQQAGCSTLDISCLTNCADLVVARNGRTWILEIKDGELKPSARRLTEGEKKFANRWKGNRYTVHSVAEALLSIEWGMQ